VKALYHRLRNIYLWQFLFLLTGTTWLLAPSLNASISARTTLISQYEVAGMPYAWLFRLGDIMAGLLLALIALRLRHSHRRMVWQLLLIIAITMVLDPILTTTCKLQGNVCVEYLSANFVLHAIETVIAGIALLGLSLYDAVHRKVAPSVIFTCFQVGYFVLLLTQVARTGRFTTLSQFIFQAAGILWLAWFVGSQLLPAMAGITTHRRARRIKYLIAAWASLNGLTAILLSLAHLHILGKIDGLYFADDTAWLAQHGVVIGVTLLYISRHLARGEKRARQLFLFLVGIEAIKYAVITPQPLLLGLYAVTFAVLFVSRPYFDRGIAQPAWQARLLDTLVILAGVALAVGVALLLITHTRHALIGHVIDHYTDFVFRTTTLPRRFLFSSLLAHTFSALTVATVWFLLWSLFRPVLVHKPDGQGIAEVRQFLTQYAASSEDYFKLWPADKQYFWTPDRQAFVAYKVVGSIAFALADPVVSTTTEKRAVLEQFVGDCRDHGLSACFLLIPAASQFLYEAVSLRKVQIGASAVIDIAAFMQTTSRDKWWRWQRNSGVKLGYDYSAVRPPHSRQLLAELHAVSDAWLTIDGHEERGFALGYFDEDYLQQCRLHLLRDTTGRLIAFANELPVFHELRQATVDLIRYIPDARRAMPVLLLHTITVLADDGRYDYFDLGFVPLAQVKSRVATLARTLGAGRFSAAGLEQFKNKFDPIWQPNYAAYDGDIGDLAMVALRLEKAMDAPITKND
jgi:lysylphosphatidylglycerol synthetase-like protein (DUF2156 family)